MRIEAIYIIYNIRTLLTYSNNFNYLETFEIKSIILKIIEIRINIRLLILLLIIIIRNISRSK